jgi:hypothetical protein
MSNWYILWFQAYEYINEMRGSKSKFKIIALFRLNIIYLKNIMAD